MLENGLIQDTICLVGLQRSGTNFVLAQLQLARPDLLVDNGSVWKHSFASEISAEVIKSQIIIVSRHPIMWLQSCLLNTSKDLRSRRNIFFQDRYDDIGAFADIYNKFYSGWIDALSDIPGKLMRYEDVLKSGIPSEAMRASGDPPDREAKILAAAVPMSLHLSETERNAYLNFECSLARPDCERFWSLLDSKLMRALSYEFSDINFVSRSTTRSLAYKIVETPGIVSQEEYEQIYALGIEAFAHDGALLDRISRWLRENGNDDAALSWAIGAQSAYYKAIELHNYHSGAHIPLADILELAIRLLSEKRSEIINSTLNYYKMMLVNSSSPHALRTVHFYLSECYRRIDRLDDAVRHAKTAVSNPEPNEAFHPWLWHSLGALLERQGSLAEALAAYEQARSLEPDNFEHILAVSRILYASGQQRDALRTLEAILDRNPNATTIFNYYISLLEARAFEDANKLLIDNCVDNNSSSAAALRSGLKYYIHDKHTCEADRILSILENHGTG